MKNIELYVPKVEDLWFRAECMNDPSTMSYNAGYNLTFDGYHYDTGCIDFPEISYKTWAEEKLTNPNFYYAYIVDKDTKRFVGYLNFNINPDTKSATMGIVIKSNYRGQGYMRPALNLMIEEARKRDNLLTLVDTVPASRKPALNVFLSAGFTITKEFTSKKFGKDETIFEIQKVLK